MYESSEYRKVMFKQHCASACSGSRAPDTVQSRRARLPVPAFGSLAALSRAAGLPPAAASSLILHEQPLVFIEQKMFQQSSTSD